MHRAKFLALLAWKKYRKQPQTAYPTPYPSPILHPDDAILHPILHPKSIAYKGISPEGCRKCRIFFKNFFRGESCIHSIGDDTYSRKHRTLHCHSRQPTPGTAFRKYRNIGLLWHKPPYFPCQSSELLPKEVRCFHLPDKPFELFKNIVIKNNVASLILVVMDSALWDWTDRTCL